jgi:hypothetical protein
VQTISALVILDREARDARRTEGACRREASGRHGNLITDPMLTESKKASAGTPMPADRPRLL